MYIGLILAVALLFTGSSASSAEYDGNLLNKIAWCESRDTATAKNPNSSASGRFQFIRGSWKYYGEQLWGDEWKEKDVFDYNDNTELASYVMQKYGTTPWNASKKCWSSPAKDS